MPGTSTVPSSPFRPWISQTPSRGSEYPRAAIDQSVSCGCTTYAALRPRGVGGAGEGGPEYDSERDNHENSSEHVFAMMHEHVFAVKFLEFAP